MWARKRQSGVLRSQPDEELQVSGKGSAQRTLADWSLYGAGRCWQWPSWAADSWPEAVGNTGDVLRGRSARTLKILDWNTCIVNKHVYNTGNRLRV